MKALFLSVLLALSCTKKSELSKDEMGLRLPAVHMEISNLHETEWLIGRPREVTITQSVSFMVDMPKVSEDDLSYLQKLKGIDSWILRLIVLRNSERQDLGSLYARFKPKAALRGQTAGAPKNVSLKIFYAAAYASERFRFFSCPAFGHTNRVTDMDIMGEDEPFDLLIGQMTSYTEKAHLVELAPSAFNGGNSLVGEYFIEIAPYDSEKKVIHAAFKRIPMYVKIVSEEKEKVDSCAGVHEEMSK